MSADDQKQRAAERALGFVEDGMVVGLGTGSTAEHFIRGLGQRVAEGLSVSCVPTSLRTEELAKTCGLLVADIDDVSGIDITVDGADEVDPDLCLIKGGGGALLREKIVAAASDRMIVIIDQNKLVNFLGAFPLPVEIVPFGHKVTRTKIRRLLIEEKCAAHVVTVRQQENGDPFLSDGGNYIVDCDCANFIDAERLAHRLNAIPGIVEHGLFIGMASSVIVGRDDRVDVLEAGA